MSDTWNYRSILDPEEMSDDWVWERLRMRRDILLNETDFRVIADAPWNIQPWIEYRQALRDLPLNTTNPREAVWPEQPAV